MTINVAINGYGRIGRNILRAHYETGKKHDLRIVAINDLGDPNTNVHLTKYDTAHGPFPGTVVADGDSMVVNGDRIRVLAQRNPAELPWRDLGVDVVLECTGFFTTKEKASAHLKGGAKKVIISAPGGKDVDATIVYGVNDRTLKASDTVISNASCTTNCLAPLVKPLQDKLGVVCGLMTTVHSYTNDQVLTDVYHEDLRRARAAAHNMIPTKTGAASALGLVMPELNGKLDGYAIRVPTINVSIVDLTFIAARDTTVDEVNAIMQAAADGELKGVLGVNTAPLVSSDFNHDPRSSIYDATLTKVVGRLVKVLSWYDNEWGFSNRMLDVAVALMAARGGESPSSTQRKPRRSERSGEVILLRRQIRNKNYLTVRLLADGRVEPNIGTVRRLFSHISVTRSYSNCTNDDAPAVHLCCRARFADSGGMFRAVGTSAR